jgi:hypothetical protein
VAPLVLGLCSLFFAWLSAYFLLLLLRSAPMLVIDESGIHDRSSPFALGLISWDQVIRAELKEAGGRPFVSLEVRSDEEILRVQPSALSRLVLRLGARRWGLTIINTRLLDVDADDVVQRINDERNRFAS